MCSWLGSQEALHDRVLTPDEALGALAAVTADQIQDLAGRLIRDESLSLTLSNPNEIDQAQWYQLLDLAPHDLDRQRAEPEFDLSR